MFHLLIDTSVWLDLAADHRQTPLFDVLLDFLKEVERFFAGKIHFIDKG